MRRLAVALLALGFTGTTPAPPPPGVVAQIPRLQPPARSPAEAAPPAQPHRSGELNCAGCHQGKHRGIVSMYLGMGGRGTPMIPSHMVQVRVECVACHTVPKEDPTQASIVGQTFRPSERACVDCHGERYRGMLERWTTTLTRMRDIVGPRLSSARETLAAVDPKQARLARARQLVDDADFNLRFVALAKGVHNVFYAADLLKLANGWADEAAALVGKPLPKTDDVLVRGGYCAVLCHEQAGVKLKATVAFRGQRLPHDRHVKEFGATCTSCHSAETHRAVTATPATCAGCHHAPANDRCESCHRAQAALFHGQVPDAPVQVEADVMAAAVTCTGCHDWSRKHSRQAVGDKCVECHEPSYRARLTEWTTGFDRGMADAVAALRRAESAVAAARRTGHRSEGAERLLKEGQQALTLVRRARPVHNPLAADALLDAARQKAEAARAEATRR